VGKLPGRAVPWDCITKINLRYSVNVNLPGNRIFIRRGHNRKGALILMTGGVLIGYNCVNQKIILSFWTFEWLINLDLRRKKNVLFFLAGRGGFHIEMKRMGNKLKKREDKNGKCER
jgi:hypothetical protein